MGTLKLNEAIARGYPYGNPAAIGEFPPRARDKKDASSVYPVRKIKGISAIYPKKINREESKASEWGRGGSGETVDIFI